MAGLSVKHSRRRVPSLVVETHHPILPLKARKARNRDSDRSTAGREKISSHKEHKEHKKAIFQLVTFVLFVLFVFFVATIQFVVRADRACFQPSFFLIFAASSRASGCPKPAAARP